MNRIDVMLDDFETQILLYRYSLRRKNPELSEEKMKIMLREKVNRKFQETNKKIIKNIMGSHFNLLNSVHKG